DGDASLRQGLGTALRPPTATDAQRLAEHPLLEPRAAVDDEHVARHVPRVVADEKRARVRDLLGRAETTERYATQQVFPDLLRRPEPLARLRRVDRTGRDRVDTNAVRRPFDGKRAREVDDT